MVFVTGEADAGKSTLTRAFAEPVRVQDEWIVVAAGNCSAQGAVGDPYLPFREVLGQVLSRYLQACACARENE